MSPDNAEKMPDCALGTDNYGNREMQLLTDCLLTIPGVNPVRINPKLTYLLVWGKNTKYVAVLNKITEKYDTAQRGLSIDKRQTYTLISFETTKQAIKRNFIVARMSKKKKDKKRDTM